MATNAWNDGLVSNVLGAESNDNVVIHFNESNGSGTFKIENAGTQRMMIDSAGKTAIGSITPQVLLDVNCGSANVLKGISVSDTDASTVGLTVNNANTSYTSGILFNINNINKAMIKANDSKLLTITTVNAAGSGLNTGMNMDTNGSIGMGTATPSSTATLHILRTEGSSGTSALKIDNQSAGGETGLLFQGKRGGDSLDTNLGRIFAQNTGSAHTDGKLNLQTIDSGGNWKTGLTVNAGNVGIGVTEPDTKLHVDGALTLTNQSAPSTVDNGNCSLFWDDTNKKLKIKRGSDGKVAEITLGSWV